MMGALKKSASCVLASRGGVMYSATIGLTPAAVLLAGPFGTPYLGTN